ncbi:hypothetical protein EHYA_08534 [Embleya hyalina]|uniref:Uncharacterized protein n=1 Tax=Embleya hyalina TaxID=516124 RepID=A0A401Z1W8_9ACTN|nr:hypothetical protein EHYA_08534 [Embleya hyalina]
MSRISDGTPLSGRATCPPGFGLSTNVALTREPNKPVDHCFRESCCETLLDQHSEIRRGTVGNALWPPALFGEQLSNMTLAKRDYCRVHIFEPSRRLVHLQPFVYFSTDDLICPNSATGMQLPRSSGRSISAARRGRSRAPAARPARRSTLTCLAGTDDDEVRGTPSACPTDSEAGRPPRSPPGADRTSAAHPGGCVRRSPEPGPTPLRGAMGVRGDVARRRRRTRLLVVRCVVIGSSRRPCIASLSGSRAGPAAPGPGSGRG